MISPHNDTPLGTATSDEEYDDRRAAPRDRYAPEPEPDELATDGTVASAVPLDDEAPQDEGFDNREETDETPARPPITHTGPAPRARRAAEPTYHRAPAGDLPMADYLTLTVPEIVANLDGLTLEEVRAVQRYEGSHRRRKTLLVKLERLTRAMASGQMPTASTRRGEAAGAR